MQGPVCYEWRGRAVAGTRERRRQGLGGSGGCGRPVLPPSPGRREARRRSSQCPSQTTGPLPSYTSSGRADQRPVPGGREATQRALDAASLRPSAFFLGHPRVLSGGLCQLTKHPAPCQACTPRAPSRHAWTKGQERSQGHVWASGGEGTEGVVPKQAKASPDGMKGGLRPLPPAGFWGLSSWELCGRVAWSSPSLTL